MLIEGSAELLAGLRKLLLQLIRFKGDGIPFVLESCEEGGNRSECRRARANDALGLELDKVVGGKLFAVDGISTVLGNIRLDQTLLENVSCGRVSSGASLNGASRWTNRSSSTRRGPAALRQKLKNGQQQQLKRGASVHTCAQHLGGVCWVWVAAGRSCLQQSARKETSWVQTRQDNCKLPARFGPARTGLAANVIRIFG